jgi:phage shock protein PspC (stress-responsive transcriptional regulator)
LLLMDFVYVAGVLAGLAVTWGLVRLCEKVS